jgi:two-component system sensor histidine kinase/response regulator
VEDSEFHLAQVLESAVAASLPMAEAKGLKLLFRVEDGLPETAIGDARHLRQALSHLMSNAVKFTMQGEVELHADYETLPGGRIILLVTVRDTGPGIEEEKLDLLFQSFRQLESGLARKHSGLGLGLALVDRLARIMGGGILVESDLGIGSRFVLRVPLRLPGSAKALRPVSRPPSGSRILMVDDNKIAQRLVKHILGRAGYELEFADDGAHGIRKASERRYDLVLMDLQMPDMDGLAATSLLRKVPGYEYVPVIALTANHSDEYRGLCEQVGMQGFLCKPFEKERLLATIQSHLG